MNTGRPAPVSAASPAVYELTVRGTIGPVVRSYFPELATRELAPHSLITGHCSGPDALTELLDLLDSKGFPANTVFVDRTMAAPTP